MYKLLKVQTARLIELYTKWIKINSLTIYTLLTLALLTKCPACVLVWIRFLNAFTFNQCLHTLHDIAL